MAKCPRCGSANASFQLRSAGTTSYSNYYKSGWRTYKSKRNYKSVGICYSCGYVWNKGSGIIENIFYYMFLFAIWPISLSVWFVLTKKIPIQRRWRLLIIFVFWGILLLFGCLENKSEDNTGEFVLSEKEELDSVWSFDHTDLRDFKYYIDENKIYLKEYKGKDKKVNIAPSYIVDGEKMEVVSLSETFTLKSVESVIIPDGVASISYNCFNSCGIKYLYFPKTIKNFSGWDYFYNVEKLYYGGTEKEWNLLCEEDRDRIDVVQIICNVSIHDLLKSDAEGKYLIAEGLVAEEPEETEEMKETENTEPFPQTEKYLINNIVLKYNEIAKYPIDNEYIEHIIDMKRPLSRTTLTFEGGVYLIITNNDYGHIMFFDYYYYKSSANSDVLFSLIRDMTKSVAENFSDEDMDIMWEKKESVRWEKTFDSGETIIFYDGSMGGVDDRRRATCEFYLYGKPEWKK